ncbi:MAG: N-acetyltransferase [Candidatus Bathyarchaeota archaeon]|nr:N-acetyltransferase [Candidatus Bathyarchaeota archaeon]
MQMYIRETTPVDLNEVLKVEFEAFSYPKEADLTRDMLGDPTARPFLSLLAFAENTLAGHILFTNAHLVNAPSVVVSILAPLAVMPKFQKRGVGGSLIRRGLELQSKSGVDLVFVLGHPSYYPRHGFVPAGKLGFKAPYPIPEKDADAWMVQALRPNIIGSVSGNVTCCDALNKPEHWKE